MKYRHPLMVFFLTLITAGIYGLIWYAKTGNEMNKKGIMEPQLLFKSLVFLPMTLFKALTIMLFALFLVIVNPWLPMYDTIIVLLVIVIFCAGLYWVLIYSYCVTKLTDTRAAETNLFLLIFLGPIGIAIIQNDFNKHKAGLVR